MSTISYETARKDFSIKSGNDIRAITWTVLDSAGSAWSFSGKTGSTLSIYEYNGAVTALKTRNESATVGLSYSSNVITWNDLWSNVNLPHGTYYYCITYTTNGNQPEYKIIDGYITIE